MAHLRVISGPVVGQVFELRRGVTIIGRSHSACDIVLDHYSVSRQHARIEFASDLYHIEDLESYNGTIVNGKGISSGPTGRRALRDRDTIEINGFRLMFEEHGTQESSGSVMLQEESGVTPEIVSTHDLSHDSSSDSTLPQNAAPKLKALLTIMEELDHAINLHDVLPKLLDSLLKCFPQAQCAFVMLRKEPDDDLKLAAWRWREDRSDSVRISHSIVEKACREKQAILTADAASDTRFGSSTWKLSLRSTMCVPLLDKQREVLGIIQLSVVDSVDPFTRLDLSVLVAVARHVAIVIENSQLHGRMLDEQRTLNQALQESEDLYRSLVDTIPLCVGRKDLEGRFVFANRALCEVLDRPLDQIVGKTDYDICPPDLAEKYRADDLQVRQTGEMLEFPEILSAPNGVRHIRTMKTATRDATGRINGTQLVFWDITQQKLAEEEIKRYAQELERSNRELDQFASVVSHDLQSPLRTITSYCQLLKRRFTGKLDGDFDEFSGYIVEGTAHMQRLIDDLLAYSRVTTQRRKMQVTDANEALDSAIANLSVVIEEQRAVVTRDELPSVFVDAIQLVQLFQNLLDNAIKYRGTEPPRIHVSAKRVDDGWQFSVRDNGIGFDMKYADRIFVIFHRLCTDTERTGTGIGLAICKRIAERHGGRIWAESQPGQGSTFHFTIATHSV